ncbi:MAG: hypothetical protein IJR47_02225 [Clostridia bacterium]|nr:hypothetical protein [Clostridia bacterium]
MGDLWERIKSWFAKVKEAWDNLELNKKLAIIVAAVIIAVTIGFAIYFLTRKEYAVLYSGMDSAEAGEIYNKLNDEGTDVKLRGSDTILVNAKQADEIRLKLSAEGYPKSGLNYEIFSGASSFGTTDMEKQIYLKFQLEQNIRQTIRRLDKINDATVMITLASESKFALSGQGSTPATASVVLDVANGESLTKKRGNGYQKPCYAKRSKPCKRQDYHCGFQYENV